MEQGTYSEVFGHLKKVEWFSVGLVGALSRGLGRVPWDDRSAIVSCIAAELIRCGRKPKREIYCDAQTSSEFN